MLLLLFLVLQALDSEAAWIDCPGWAGAAEV